jgi:hypothetical protein
LEYYGILFSRKLRILPVNYSQILIPAAYKRSTPPNQPYQDYWVLIKTILSVPANVSVFPARKRICSTFPTHKTSMSCSNASLQSAAVAICPHHNLFRFAFVTI